MAMNKKEQAAFDEAILKAETLAALRWTEKVEPDMDIPTSTSNKTAFGYGMNTSTLRAFETWSQNGRHSTGRDPNKIASQNGIKQYSTELLALKALRHALELDYAKNLLAIDKRIERVKGVYSE